MLPHYQLLFCLIYYFFFLNDTPPTEIYTLSLHDALPIFCLRPMTSKATSTPRCCVISMTCETGSLSLAFTSVVARSEEHTSELSHSSISYAVFCLKKKTTNYPPA